MLAILETSVPILKGLNHNKISKILAQYLQYTSILGLPQTISFIQLCQHGPINRKGS